MQEKKGHTTIRNWPDSTWGRLFESLVSFWVTRHFRSKPSGMHLTADRVSQAPPTLAISELQFLFLQHHENLKSYSVSHCLRSHFHRVLAMLKIKLIAQCPKQLRPPCQCPAPPSLLLTWGYASAWGLLWFLCVGSYELANVLKRKGTWNMGLPSMRFPSPGILAFEVPHYFVTVRYLHRMLLFYVAFLIDLIVQMICYKLQSQKGNTVLASPICIGKLYVTFRSCGYFVYHDRNTKKSHIFINLVSNLS